MTPAEIEAMKIQKKEDLNNQSSGLFSFSKLIKMQSILNSSCL